MHFRCFCDVKHLQQVHGYFQEDVSHDSAYSRVCGVAVRAGGDLFVYDNCRGDSSGRVRLYECEDAQLRVVEISETTYEVNSGDAVIYSCALISKELFHCLRFLNRTFRYILN